MELPSPVTHQVLGQMVKMYELLLYQALVEFQNPTTMPDKRILSHSSGTSVSATSNAPGDEHLSTNVTVDKEISADLDC